MEPRGGPDEARNAVAGDGAPFLRRRDLETLERLRDVLRRAGLADELEAESILDLTFRGTVAHVERLVAGTSASATPGLDPWFAGSTLAVLDHLAHRPEHRDLAIEAIAIIRAIDAWHFATADATTRVRAPADDVVVELDVRDTSHVRG